MGTKITVLGVGNLLTPDLLNTSYLIEYNPPTHPNAANQYYLIDCGFNVYQHLISNHDYCLDNLSIFITHNHPDHIGSLGALIYYLYFVKGKEKIYIYTGSENVEPLRKVLDATITKLPRSTSFRSLDHCPYKVSSSPSIAFYTNFVLVDHCGMPAYGINFEVSRVRKVFFTGDTDVLNPNHYIMEEAKLIFHDAVVKGPVRGVHSWVEELNINYPPEIKSKLILTHHGMIIGEPGLCYAHPGDIYAV